MNTITVQYTGAAAATSMQCETASGQIGTLRAEFIFSPDWEAYPIRTAVFAGSGEMAAVPLEKDNSCTVPAEVLKYSGRLSIGVFANAAQGKSILRYCGQPGFVYIPWGVCTNAAAPPPGNPTAYEQLLVRLSAKLDAYQGIANAGKLLYVGEDGAVALLQLGTGVEIIDGRLCITGAVEPGEPSGLPGVSDADNGKVLTVVGGKWAAKELPKYEGVYIITPSADKEQTLRTAQRLLDADVTVKPIPYYEMDNGSEGTTVYIGSETEIIME